MMAIPQTTYLGGLDRIMSLPAIDDDVAKTTRPTLVVAFLYFQEPLALGHVKDVLAHRLLDILRFRSLLRQPAVKGGQPYFEEVAKSSISIDDLVTERFDVRTEEEVTAFATELYEKDMGLELPRWRALVFNDMADGRSMLCWVVDHAIGDGVSLTAALMKCLDDMPNKPALGSAKRKIAPPSYLARASAMVGGTAKGLLSDLLPADQPNMLKLKDHRNPGSRKTFKQSPPIPLGKVRAIAAKLGGATINDVLFVVVSLTLRQYFQKHDKTSLSNNKVRANFPLDMRPSGANALEDKWFGNLISQGQLQFPVHLDDPLAVFQHLKSQVDKIKYSPEPLIKERVVNAIAATSLLCPQTKANLSLDAFGQVTAMFSNVPGPNGKVLFAGQELDDIAFAAFAPIGLYFGVLSYNGHFRAAVCCDADCEPYPERLTNEWVIAFDRVYQAAMQLPTLSRL